jgi:hypothetical protein
MSLTNDELAVCGLSVYNFLASLVKPKNVAYFPLPPLQGIMLAKFPAITPEEATSVMDELVRRGRVASRDRSWCATDSKRYKSIGAGADPWADWVEQ